MVIAGKKMYTNNIPTQNTLGLAEDVFKKQRYYNHTESFRNENDSKCTTLSSYVWKMKKTKKETLTLVWQIIQTAAPYRNMTKQSSLCLHEELAILMYPNQIEILNKRSELVSKCWHKKKFLLQTFNSND